MARARLSKEQRKEGTEARKSLKDAQGAERAARLEKVEEAKTARQFCQDLTAIADHQYRSAINDLKQWKEARRDMDREACEKAKSGAAKPYLDARKVKEDRYAAFMDWYKRTHGRAPKKGSDRQAESDDFVRQNVMGWRPELVPIWEQDKHIKSLKSGSPDRRFEKFQQYIHDYSTKDLQSRLDDIAAKDVEDYFEAQAREAGYAAPKAKAARKKAAPRKPREKAAPVPVEQRTQRARQYVSERGEKLKGTRLAALGGSAPKPQAVPKNTIVFNPDEAKEPP